jgi:amidophosphoribosyltransferase
VRYPTAGSGGAANAQPFYVNSPYGIAMAHNGNLTNSDALSHELFETEMRHLNTDSDSEVLLNVFAHELQARGKLHPAPDDMFDAVAAVHRRCRGGYAAVAMLVNLGVVAFRDPFGIRPLVIGQRGEGDAREYMVASESVALDVLGFTLLGDVAPGEAVLSTRGASCTGASAPRIRSFARAFSSTCILRARTAFIDEISVYKTRKRQGRRWRTRSCVWPEHDIDVVIPVPDSSRTAGLPWRTARRQVPRGASSRTATSAAPSSCRGSSSAEVRAPEAERHRLEFEGRTCCWWTTPSSAAPPRGRSSRWPGTPVPSGVYLASAAPPVRYPNVYGIDMPSARNSSPTGAAKTRSALLIGADWLIYQDLDELMRCSREGNPSIEHFECSVFDGHYVTGDVDEAYLAALDAQRNDEARRSGARRKRGGRRVGIHNDFSSAGESP